MVKTKFIKKRIDYNGSQLSPHFIFKNFNIIGDAIVSFCGKCNIENKYMIDLVDAKQKQEIKSLDMLHFICEFFFCDIEKINLLQRLFISIIKDEIEKNTNIKTIERKRSDIYDGKYKISISIATVSNISSLLHIGINILSKDTPVPTKGLNDYNITPEKFAKTLLKKFSDEIYSLSLSKCKVKSVV